MKIILAFLMCFGVKAGELRDLSEYKMIFDCSLTEVSEHFELALEKNTETKKITASSEFLNGDVYITYPHDKNDNGYLTLSLKPGQKGFHSGMIGYSQISRKFGGTIFYFLNKCPQSKPGHEPMCNNYKVHQLECSLN